MADEPKPGPVPADGMILRPPRGGKGIGDYTLHDFAARWMMQQDDIAEVERYSEANAALMSEGQTAPRVVFIGDSITEFWTALEIAGSGGARVNRGIAGQNTSQMLLRFEDDVVALRPAIVVILGGSNDLRCYVGDPATIAATATARIVRNITAMVDIASACGIAALVASIPPVGRDRDIVSRDPATIVSANTQLKTLARSRAHGFVDFHAVLLDARGFLDTRFSDDGVHPNPLGYQAMMAALEDSLGSVDKLLRGPLR